MSEHDRPEDASSVTDQDTGEATGEVQAPAPNDEAGAPEASDVAPEGTSEEAPEAAEIERLTDALARVQAEMVNQERRLEREMDKARKFALERIMRDFVQVLDSLDQALAALDDDGDAAAPAVEGLLLTRKLAIKVLEGHGLEVIDPQAEAFDPNWHEAMTAVPSADVEPDAVLEVLQKGYALHGRLLRPARVVVAKAP